ncbi:MAG: hypothetical protein K6A61_07075 [Butyrivibrio sp.]|nr:hypothetical protein [Butyrivibrio sp.]
MSVLDGFDRGINDFAGTNQKAVLVFYDCSELEIKKEDAAKPSAGKGAIGTNKYDNNISGDIKKYRFECQFNPAELSITGSKSEVYTTEKNKGSAKTNIRLSFTLIFDKTDMQNNRNYSVQPEVEALTDIVMVKKGIARFTWGEMSYCGIINSVNADYAMFNVNGEPIRATVAISMTVYDEEFSGELSDFWVNVFKENNSKSEEEIIPKGIPESGINLEKLDEKYEGHYKPIVIICVGEKDITQDKKVKLRVKDVSVKATSELKAGIAEYSIITEFNKDGLFATEDLKKYISMGTCITIYMGHANESVEVFRGFIAGVNFLFKPEEKDNSVIRVTALDIKGIMMSNCSSKRLKANYYSDAVKEILDQPIYQSIKSNNGITDIIINDTPDKLGGGKQGEDEDNRIETVAESDYEFVVRAAKRFNFEFFTIGGNVVFRKAKSNDQIMGVITPHSSVLSFDVGYDITGVVGNAVVRTLDIGKATKIEAKKKNANKFSLGSKAKPLINGQTYVYIDSAIESQNEAENRAEYILEDTSYRLGSLKMTLKGIPELVPGRFIALKGFGAGVSNKFYITDVTHEFDGFKYTTTIYGKASTLQ